MSKLKSSTSFYLCSLDPNPMICPNDGQDIRLVILISSAPGHFSSRDAIRLTWGHYAQRLDVSIAFIIGKLKLYYVCLFYCA